MKSIKDIFSSTEFVLILAIFLGLLLKADASLKMFIDYLLGIMMFFSIRQFFKHKLNIRERYKSIFISVLLSYVLLSGLFLLFGSLFFKPLSPYHIGFILLAIIPPAISIVPLCYATKCDPETADASLFLSFLLSLLIIPLTMYALFHQSLDVWILVKIMLTIIVVPLILAFLFRKVKSSIFNYTKIITNICLGFVLLIAVSLNRNAFFVFDSTMLKIYVAVALAIFGSGLLVYYISKKYFSMPEAINFSLYASQKNEGTALAIAVLMFTPATVIPVVIALVMQFIFFVILKKYVISKL